MSRVLIRAYVVPGPAIKSAFLNTSYVVRNKVIAEPVALIDRTPKLAGLRMDRDADSVANTGRVDTPACAVRVEFEHIGTIFFAQSRVFVDIRTRSDGNQHLLAVACKCNIACPMPTTSQSGATWNVGHYNLRFSARFDVSVLIWKAHYGFRVAHIDVLRICPQRIKSDPKRLLEITRID